MTDKPFQSGSLLLVDQKIGNVAHFNKKIPLCVSSILIDLQRHSMPPFKDKFIINNSF